jgi:hypothetical protein
MFVCVCYRSSYAPTSQYASLKLKFSLDKIDDFDKDIKKENLADLQISKVSKGRGQTQ